jgi:hypothetical protein
MAARYEEQPAYSCNECGAQQQQQQQTRQKQHLQLNADDSPPKLFESIKRMPSHLLLASQRIVVPRRACCAAAGVTLHGSAH